MARKEICHRCGAQAYADGLCREHFAEKHNLIELKPRYEVTVCSRCGMVKLSNRWVAWIPENFIKDKMKVDGKLNEFNVFKEGKTAYRLEADGLLSIGVPKHEEKKLIIHENRLLCPMCTRVSGGYYEAIVQLRGENIGEVMEAIDGLITKFDDRKAFYRSKERREGLDLYMGSKNVAKKVANMLRGRYNAELKTSFKIAGFKEGRELRRTTISVRLPKREVVPNV
jgi:nonsense-mediated mRNA decay protein 3